MNEICAGFGERFIPSVEIQKPVNATKTLLDFDIEDLI
jgi:hypothetical protein